MKKSLVLYWLRTTLAAEVFTLGLLNDTQYAMQNEYTLNYFKFLANGG